MPEKPDHFALLEEPRRPWLEPEELKAKFLRLARVVHPDHLQPASESEKSAASARSSELNAAYQGLREPKTRLLHLLELERGEKPSGLEQVPGAMVDLFFEFGQLCRDVDTFIARKAEVTSPVLKVQWFQESLRWTDQLTRMVQQLEARQTELEGQVKLMNAAWEQAPPIGDPQRPAHLPLPELEQTYRTLSYLSRWTSQLRERLAQLFF